MDSAAVLHEIESILAAICAWLQGKYSPCVPKVKSSNLAIIFLHFYCILRISRPVVTLEVYCDFALKMNIKNIFLGRRPRINLVRGRLDQTVECKRKI